MAKFNSKHGTVSRSSQELYMMFVDLSNFTRILPEDKKAMVTADYDTLRVTIQGFNVGVRVTGRVPYSLIQLQDDNAPFHFGVSINFLEIESYKTDFSIEVEADLNLMMKMMLGSKIQEALDKVVDGLVAVSEGRMPEGVPSDFKF